ncbi:hypothetical protein C8R44DRAFT_378210 [Mycena epipterygia]|nr:hypothetical protein C8R44DRAFT_378210 [Mycena epipterygia]
MTVCMTDFPPELILEILPHLCLKSLIVADGVCRQWKQLITVAEIHPIRRALLALFKTTVNDPLFLTTRPWLVSELETQARNGQLFDDTARQSYIDALETHPGNIHIPEDFRLWILEWPARAVIACAWPGLPIHQAGPKDNIQRMEGCNFLGLNPSFVKTLKIGWIDGTGNHSDDGHFSDYSSGSDSDSESSTDSFDESKVGEYIGNVPGLLIFETEARRQTWLTLKEGQKFSVYVLADSNYNLGESSQHPSWLSWLEAQLKKIRNTFEIEKYRQEQGTRDVWYKSGNHDAWFEGRVAAVREEVEQSTTTRSSDTQAVDEDESSIHPHVTVF